MQIEEMSLNDLPRVATLSAQLGYPFPTEVLGKRFSLISKDPDIQLYVMKNSYDSVIGWIQVNRESSSLLSEPRAEISALIVDQLFQGQGIGRALLKQAEIWAEEKGLPLIRIRSNTNRTEAHQFYQKQGYDIQKSWHLFTKEI